ncbi:hypothetical protein [Mycobacterium aquaticum]|uniref:Uncharacterized protein n=1 Tax=Mycobacterium aquaticum TaxID=1927124 RepID=A0A1X0B8P1_9MYCO|nr:hypothetical protein [Mycobacterium aquaticum]ORA38697.1 hypothetical protein BST13_04770 [Mycobacterium aquaticum]
MEFKMNPDFERQMKRELQQTLDKVYRQVGGRPLAEVKAALKRIGVDEPELSPLATAISDGREPRVQ